MPHQLGEISQYIYDNLMNGEEVSLEGICNHFNWEINEISKNKARAYITASRKRIEKETGDLLKCKYGQGIYYLVSFSKDDVKDEANGEAEKRKQRAMHTVDTFGRSAKIIIVSYPELTDDIEAKISDLLYAILNVRQDTKSGNEIVVTPYKKAGK
jgi:hypothetical protein